MSSPNLNNNLGNLVRLMPLALDDLPPHPKLDHLTNGEPVVTTEASDVQAKPPRTSLSVFLTAILSEAVIFIDSTVPATFHEGSEKPSAPSTSKVRILKREITASELSNVPWSDSKVNRSVDDKVKEQGEAWFVRKSQHVNRKEEGSVDWSELDFAIRVDHNEHEGEYTPALFDTYRVLDWDAETLALGQLGDFEDIRLRVYEMCHKLPFPLTTRTFPVLVAAAKTGPTESVIVHVPIDIRKLPEAFYSNGRNIREGDSEVKRKKPVLGAYTSIERARILPDEKIEWTMAVASDAKGSLPMVFQKMGLPGAIVKDVGMVIDWCSSKRKGMEGT